MDPATLVAVVLYALGVVGGVILALYLSEHYGTGETSEAAYMVRATTLSLLWPAAVVFAAGMILLTLVAPSVALRVRRWVLTGEA